MFIPNTPRNMNERIINIEEQISYLVELLTEAQLESFIKFIQKQENNEK